MAAQRPESKEDTTPDQPEEIEVEQLEKDDAVPSKDDPAPAQPQVVEVEELEKEDGPPSVIEIWQEWRWRRKAANGEVVLTSDPYPTEAEARQAAEKENPDLNVQEV